MMGKKDFQAIAAAINGLYIVPVPSDCSPVVYRADVIDVLADVLAASNPRFDRARFLEACETGRCKGMRQVNA